MFAQQKRELSAGVRVRWRPFADFANAMALDMALDATDSRGFFVEHLGGGSAGALATLLQDHS